jgi:hypothetical protein
MPPSHDEFAMNALPSESSPSQSDTPAAPKPPRAGDLALALALLAVAGFALVAGVSIETRTLVDNQDPGPRALPWFLACVLAVGGLLELVLFMRHRKAAYAAPSPPPAVAMAGDSNRGFKIAVAILALLLLYCVLTPWAGFMAATLLFSVLAMRLLGTGWGLAAVTTLILLVAIRILFVSLFKVQLPPGVLGIPFS